MSSLKQNDAISDKKQSTIYDENPEPIRNTLTAEELFEMQAMNEEARKKLAASALANSSNTSSTKQEYPSPPRTIIKADSSSISTKRAAEDELSSSPKKIVIRRPRREIVGNFKGHLRSQLLHNQMAAKIRLNEAKKKDPSTAAFEHLPNVDPLRPQSCRIDSQRLWDEESLNLGQYPRLVTTKLTYRYQEVKNPWNDAWEYVCFPITPPDDIEKSLHLGGATKHVKWTGFWAEKKLQKEIAKYEMIKEFWLFNYSVTSVVPFFAGLDKKEEFCVGLFSKELKSPWMCTWLREFLGDEIMDEIKTAMESVDEGR